MRRSTRVSERHLTEVVGRHAKGVGERHWMVVVEIKQMSVADIGSSEQKAPSCSTAAS